MGRPSAGGPATPSLEFCTYFDRNYLLQGLALYESLEACSAGFRLWILCLDELSTRVITRLHLPHATCVSVDDLIASQPRLRTAKGNRSRVEFYYACTPWLIDYVMARAENSAGVTYLDADMFFFNDPATVRAEAPGANMLIVPHRSGDERMEAKNGRYNVCYVAFSTSGEARRCLRWWGDVVLRSTALGNGVWGDQKYLDEFQTRFHGAHAILQPGAALAPWNVRAHRIAADRGKPTVDGQPLVGYHFARFLLLSRQLFIPIRREWVPRHALTLIYSPYMRSIRSALDRVRVIEPGYRTGYTRHNLRGVILGALAGRVFHQGRLGLRRVGIYIPSGRPEWRALRGSLRHGRAPTLGR